MKEKLDVMEMREFVEEGGRIGPWKHGGGIKKT
jgi:hypothetical protein